MSDSKIRAEAALEIGYPDLTPIDLWHIEREACKRSLSEFIKQAWHVIEPGNPYVHGWHIDALSEHLEAVTNGEINRLLINCPPGVMKSLAVSVFWPMWEWGPRDLARYRYVAASHTQKLAIRDNMRSRHLVKSDWYQSRWRIPLAEDQDAKSKFENVQRGFREAAAAYGMTGSRGDRVIIDDPHSVEEALSDAKRETDLRWFDETVPTRLNHPKRSAIVVIMQRLHEDDISGHILERELGYEHLMLPMEFEPERRCKTSIGFTDPRKKDGELLFPGRFPREVVERDKKAMGSLATAAQNQQSPTPRGGGMIKSENFVIEPHGPAKIVKQVRYWDKAGTKGGTGARSAGALVALDEDNAIWVLDVVFGRWNSTERETKIEQIAKLDGTDIPIWVEQEPGSGGKESAENTIKRLLGWAVKAERVTGDKATRAEPFAGQVGIKNVKLLRAPWNREFIAEAKSFPVGRTKDMIDAAAGAYNKLANTVKFRIRTVGAPRSLEEKIRRNRARGKDPITGR